MSDRPLKPGPREALVSKDGPVRPPGNVFAIAGEANAALAARPAIYSFICSSLSGRNRRNEGKTGSRKRARLDCRCFSDGLPMNEVFAADRRSREIDLARCADFNLGAARVSPSRRRLTGSSIGTVELEPRVMQVLVVLHRAGGAVLSRDDLIHACWGGRIVGDDALNRCIGALRRLARDGD